MPESIASWIKENNNVYTHVGYYYRDDSEQAIGPYYNFKSKGSYFTANLDDASLRKTFENEFSHIQSAQLAVLKPHKKTLQNAMHMLYSPLFSNASPRHSSDLILQGNLSHLRLKKSAYLDSYQNEPTCSCSDCRSRCKQAQEANQQKESMVRKEFSDQKAQHKRLVDADLVKSDKRYRQDILHSLSDTLLKPFLNNNDKQAFLTLLLSKDNQRNSVFYYALQQPLALIQPILNEIQTLSEDQKRRLLMERNENGISALHMIVRNPRIFRVIKTIFSTELLLDAMVDTDLDGNMPLHSKGQVETLLELIQLVRPEAHVEGQPSMPLWVLFRRNREGQSLLHTVFIQDATANSKAEIVAEANPFLSAVLKMLPDTQKLLEQDENGCTPFHYAIKANRVADVKAMLAHLTLTQHHALVAKQDKFEQTILDYALEYGSVTMLGMLSESINSFSLQPLTASHVVKARLRNNPFHVTIDDVEKVMSKNNILLNSHSYFSGGTDQQSSLKNTDGKNPLHLAYFAELSKSNKLATDMTKTALEKLVGELPDAHPLLAQDNAGCTPLHYAIQANQVTDVRIMLEKLQPADIKVLSCLRNNNNQTVFHYALQYASRDMLDLLASHFSPGDLHAFTSTVDAKSLVKKNPYALTSADVKDVAVKNTSLFAAYDYFVKTYNGESTNFNSRFVDFKNCLQAIEAGLDSRRIYLPEESPDFFGKKYVLGFFSGSENYHCLRASLGQVGRREWNAFKLFLDDQANSSGTVASKSYYKKRVAQQLIQALTPAEMPTPSAPSYSKTALA